MKYGVLIIQNVKLKTDQKVYVKKTCGYYYDYRLISKKLNLKIYHFVK